MTNEEYGLAVDVWNELKLINNNLNMIANALQAMTRGEIVQSDLSPEDIAIGLGRPSAAVLAEFEREFPDPMNAPEIVGADAEGDGGAEL